jgi:hypothetical protein
MVGRNRYNVIGAYIEMRDAREAIQALQFAGVEAGDIELLGERAAQAAEKADRKAVTAPRDAGIATRIAGRAIRFGAAGAIVGAVLGLVLAAAGIEFGRIGDSVAIQSASWATFGAVVGALAGAYSGLSIAPAWELTFEPVEDGEVLVGVHSENAREVEKAEHVLKDKGAVRVARVDANGRPHPA